jgi:hypothetical protein
MGAVIGMIQDNPTRAHLVQMGRIEILMLFWGLSRALPEKRFRQLIRRPFSNIIPIRSPIWVKTSKISPIERPKRSNELMKSFVEPEEANLQSLSSFLH